MMKQITNTLVLANDTREELKFQKVWYREHKSGYLRFCVCCKGKGKGKIVPVLN
jgi:hypothetical protein